MSDPASLAAAFSREGVVLVAGVLSGAALAAVADAASSPPPGRAGTRCLLGESWCRVLAAGLRADIRLAALLPPGYVAVQCTLFEKSPARNWLVPLHQDLSIPVAERLDEAGWTGWSRKEDAWFVQAPAAVLAELVALRLHLDDCGPDDGPLRVVPGSHVHGVLPDGAAARGSVVALPAASFNTSFPQESTVAPRSARRKPTGPRGPVSVAPFASLTTVPTG